MPPVSIRVHREGASCRGGRDIDRRDRLFEAGRVNRLPDGGSRHPEDEQSPPTPGRSP